MIRICNGLPIVQRIARHGRSLLSPGTRQAQLWQRFSSSQRVTSSNAASRAPGDDSKLAAGSLNRDTDQLKDPEAFYNFWLSKNVTVQPLRTYCSTILEKLDSEQCSQQLPDPKLRADPLTFFDAVDKERNLDLARLHLEAYIASRNLFLPAKKVVREHCIQARPGTRALLWLWNSERPELSADILLNVGFTRTLVSCVVAEGIDEYLWEWMGLLAAPVTDRRLIRELSYLKGSLLRLIAEAQAYWADGASVLSKPVESYLRARDVKTRATKNSDRLCARPSIRPLGLWLVAAIRRGGSGDIPLDTFDRFADNLKLDIHADPDAREFLRSEVLLHRPTAPDARPMLQFFRAADAAPSASIFAQSLLSPDSGRVAYLLLWDIVRAAQALQTQGQTEDARWLLRLGYKSIPDPFDAARFGRRAGARPWAQGYYPPAGKAPLLYQVSDCGADERLIIPGELRKAYRLPPQSGRLESRRLRLSNDRNR